MLHTYVFGDIWSCILRHRKITRLVHYYDHRHHYSHSHYHDHHIYHHHLHHRRQQHHSTVSSLSLSSLSPLQVCSCCWNDTQRCSVWVDAHRVLWRLRNRVVGCEEQGFYRRHECVAEVTMALTLVLHATTLHHGIFFLFSFLNGGTVTYLQHKSICRQRHGRDFSPPNNQSLSQSAPLSLCFCLYINRLDSLPVSFVAFVSSARSGT